MLPKIRKAKKHHFGSDGINVHSSGAEIAFVASLKGEDPFATKKSDWVERYRKQRTETIDKREQRRRDKREENEEYIEQQRQPRIKDNLVTFGNSRRPGIDQLPPVQTDQVLPVEHWKEIRDHNDFCERSGLWAPPSFRVECMYCPVVTRMDALDEAEKIRFGDKWVCDLCQLDMGDTRSHLESIRAMKQYEIDETKACKMLQARMRAWNGQRRFRLLRKGMVRAQAILRGKLERQAFVIKFGVIKRPCTLKILHANNVEVADWAAQGGMSDPFCIATMVLHSNPESQVFRFDTKMKELTLDPVWDQHYVVPGAPGDATWVFTVCDRDKGSSRDDFLGQAVVRWKECGDLWMRGGAVTVPLESMLINPKESNNTTLRLGNSDSEGRGTITIEFVPHRMDSSVCGWVNISSNMGGARRWWSMLTDSHLRLYKNYGATKERHLFNMKDAVKVLLEPPNPRNKFGSVELRMRNGTQTFEGMSYDLTKEWYHKLRGAIQHSQNDIHKKKEKAEGEAEGGEEADGSVDVDEGSAGGADAGAPEAPGNASQNAANASAAAAFA
jgi:hypothetical protein